MAVSAWPQPEVVFKFSAKNSFGGWQGAELNEIFESLEHPDYIANFISRLRGKRKILTRTVIVLQLRLDVTDTFPSNSGLLMQ